MGKETIVWLKCGFESSSIRADLSNSANILGLSEEELRKKPHEELVDIVIAMQKIALRFQKAMPHSELISEVGPTTEAISYDLDESSQCSQYDLLGEGGFGKVFSYTGSMDQKKIAVKALLIESEEDLKRAGKEIRLLAKLPRHPNLVQYSSSSKLLTANGRLCNVLICMEWCNNGSLHNFLSPNVVETDDECMRIRLRQSFSLFQDCTNGLEVLHQECGIVHRDIKPGNILLVTDKDGFCRAKLADFGLSASVGEMAVIAGSPFFTAPEQWLDDKPLASADIFSLGTVLFALMCDFPDAYILQERLRNGDPKTLATRCKWPFSISWNAEVFGMIESMTQDNPADRPELCDVKHTANILFNDLSKILVG